MKPLLVIDGDSLAHRAYHAMPKSIRLNGVLGFANMVSRLWEAEEPRAVLVGWDTYEVPTYRHKEFEPSRAKPVETPDDRPAERSGDQVEGRDHGHAIVPFS